MIVNISNTGLVAMTNKLEKLKKSALPIAIGNTLNQAAFDVKQNTMIRTSKADFINRKDNFFKANSKVNKSTGFNIKTMKAEVGFKSLGGTNLAVEDLDKQEHGGTINKRSYIPLSTSRFGKSSTKMVKPNARLKKITKIINAKNVTGASKKEKFIRAVLKAGVGGYVLGSDMKGETILWRVNSLASKLKTRKLDITPLYDYKKGRKVHVKPVPFMKQATMITAKKLDDFYIQNGERQVNKVWK